MATAKTVEYPAATEAPAQAPDQAPPAETQTAPRLSEALRYGQMNVDQSFGSFVDSKGNMCALGTIWYGMGYDVEYDAGVGQFVLKYPEWGFLMERMNTAPLREGICSKGAYNRCGSHYTTIASVVMHWNDDHRMPRNQIADRLSQFGL